MYRFNSRRGVVIGALLVSVVGTGASAQTYRQAVAATAPVASFQLDAPNMSSTNGTYTTTWQNVSSGTGAPIAGAAGNAGALFDGTGATSVIDTSLTGMTPGRGSIVAWINAAMLPSAAGRTFYIAGESQFGNDFDFQFDQDNMLSFCVAEGGSTCLRGAVGNNFANSWHMVTAAYDATRASGLDTQSIYLDGALLTTRTGNIGDQGHSSAFTIGYSSVFGGREFGGLIDEVSVYDRELTATEISGLYASRNVSGGPVAVVPEPATWTMMMLGLGAVGAAMRRRPRSVHRLV